MGENSRQLMNVPRLEGQKSERVFLFACYLGN